MSAAAMFRGTVRPAPRGAGWLLLLGVLGACVNGGQSTRDAEINRLRGVKGVALVSLEPRQAVFMARQQQIVVAPAAGLCVEEGAMDLSRDTAFLLLSDCAPEIAETDLRATDAGEVVEMTLPPAFPGLVTVSVSTDPLIRAGDDPDRALDNLVAFLETPAGRQSLSRHGAGGEVEIVETRRIGGALYVLVQENRGEAFSVFAPRYWRAFVELNQRLAVVTVSAVSDAEIGSDDMLAQLARQTASLRNVNGMPSAPEELRLAEATAGSGSDGRATLRRIARRQTRVAVAPARAPQPGANPRPVAVKAVTPRPVSRTETGPAPGRAPQAPPRKRG